MQLPGKASPRVISRRSQTLRGVAPFAWQGQLCFSPVTESIARPVAQALECANTIANGDLREMSLDAGGDDEAAQLLRAVAILRESLSLTLAGISQTAGQLSSAAKKLSMLVSNSNDDLQAQNSELEQAATAITEISQAVDGGAYGRHWIATSVQGHSTMISVLELRHVIESGFKPFSCNCTVNPDGSLMIKVFDPSTERIEFLATAVSAENLTSNQAIANLVLERHSEMSSRKTSFHVSRRLPQRNFAVP